MIHTKFIVGMSAALALLLMLTAANSCSTSSESPALVAELDTVPNVPSGTTQFLDPNAADAATSNVRENEEQRQELKEQERTPTAEGPEEGSEEASSTSEQKTEPTVATIEVSEAENEDAEDAEPEDASASSTTSTFEVDLEEPAFNANSPVSTVGIGDVFFGMTPTTAAREAQTEWVGKPRSGRDCYLIRPINGPEDVTLWVYKGHIEGVSVENSNIRTSSGLGVGTTQEKLLEALGRKLALDGHPTEESWTQAVFTPEDEKDAAFRVVFDLGENEEVVRYWAGRVELAVLNGYEMFEREEC